MAAAKPLAGDQPPYGRAWPNGAFLRCCGADAQICTPLRPNCEGCAIQTLCPSAFKTHLESAKKAKD